MGQALILTYSFPYIEVLESYFLKSFSFKLLIFILIFFDILI
jgi:hypothetical protein